MLEKSERLEQVLRRVGDLPALPSIVAEVMQVTDDPSATLTQISECIQQDPALTAKILKVSNSPFYGMRQHVGTLKLALVILGVREVRNIVLGVSVFDMLRDGSIDPRFMQDFWQHSVLVAGLSKRINVHFALGLQGEDFIAGLLHDMGKMVLLRYLGSQYKPLCVEAEREPRLLPKIEAETLGFDHADAAAAVASHWNLPQTLLDALWLHHEAPGRVLPHAKDPQLAALVRIANHATHDDLTQEDAHTLSSCTDEEAWATLANTDKYPESAAQRREALTGFVNELRTTMATTLW